MIRRVRWKQFNFINMVMNMIAMVTGTIRAVVKVMVMVMIVVIVMVIVVIVVMIHHVMVLISTISNLDFTNQLFCFWQGFVQYSSYKTINLLLISMSIIDFDYLPFHILVIYINISKINLSFFFKLRKIKTNFRCLIYY